MRAASLLHVVPCEGHDAGRGDRDSEWAPSLLKKF
jgi:hypothetical protein